jgi:hypothetical protein
MIGRRQPSNAQRSAIAERRRRAARTCPARSKFRLVCTTRNVSAVQLGVVLGVVQRDVPSAILPPFCSPPNGGARQDTQDGFTGVNVARHVRPLQSREFHDAYSAPFSCGNFLVAIVDSVIELLKALSFVAVLAPITRPSKEAVFPLRCSDDDPHCVSCP